ncbi:Leucine-rich repeat domain superfamily [Sesbania bispinosa]|nr:Leucine-rich repeat domain superfamily [Sesbania bispinosa]
MSKEMTELSVTVTAIHELPPSIWHNSKLISICLQRCGNLNINGNKLSNHPRLWSLRELSLSGCTQINALDLQFIFDVMQCLIYLDLSNCCNIRALPDNTKNLSSLTRLYLDDCRNLVSLPELPSSLEKLSALNCTSLEGDFTIHRLVNEHMFQNLPEKGYIIKSVVFPGAKVPDLFSFRTSGASITISHDPKVHLQGFIFCVILSDGIFDGISEIIINIISENDQVLGEHSHHLWDKSLISDHVVCRYGNNFRSFDQCKLSFEFKLQSYFGELSTVGIKGCGVFPVHKGKGRGLEQLTPRKKRKRELD